MIFEIVQYQLDCLSEACPSITGLFRQKGAFRTKKGLFGQKGAIVNLTSFILSTKGMYFEQ